MSDFSFTGIEVKGIHKTIDSTKKAFPKTIEAVDSSVSSTVNILGYLPNTINEYVQNSLNKTRTKLHQKLQNTPPENITQPPVHIAAPALQAACYSADCDELHDMFANLLASAMNIEKQRIVHPSFIEIIKQLSPLEAKILSVTPFINQGSFPMCTIRLQVRGALHPLGEDFRSASTGVDLYKNIAIYNSDKSLPPLDFMQISSISDNLTRLHIISVSDHWLSDPNHYEDLLKIYKSYVATQRTYSEQEIAFIPFKGEITAFGHQFFQSCIL